MGLDCIISPGSWHCAFKNEDAQDLGSIFNYFLIWNLLNCPTGVVPVTKVLQGEDQEVFNDGYNDDLTRRMRNSIKDSVGMPLAVQVSTLVWQDEKCLGIMKQVEKAVAYKKEL